MRIDAPSRILYSKETENLTSCPLDGSKLIRRKGLDDLETLKVRLKEYKERTFPLLDYFKEERYRSKKDKRRAIS